MNISKVITKELKIINNKNGDILHALKVSEKEFKNFGEAYFSKINHKNIKAWKKHQKMTCNLIVPFGRVHFVCIDPLGNIFSETIGFDNYKRLTIPPEIWFGFKGLYEPFSMILNISNIEHDQNEMNNIDQNKFEYNWSEIK